MRYGIKKISNFKIRMDVNFHLSDESLSMETWELSDLKEIIVRDPNCYGFHYCKKGVPIIRISDLKNPFVDFSSVARISDKTHEKFKKTHLEKYDILMSVRGVSIGKIGIYLGEYKKSNISPNIIIIRLKNKELAPYVAMALVSSIGQNQIQRIIAGSSKPTITAPMINKIEIPVIDNKLQKQISELFITAEKAKVSAIDILSRVENIFKKAFVGLDVKDKEVTYKINFKDLDNRWDPHYHNPKYQRLRKFIDEHQNKKILCSEIDSVTESLTDKYAKKIGYIEINNVNNITGIIEGCKYDYIKKLPSGGKIPLIEKDILIGKVRPYRNLITIFRETLDKEMVTVSKNAFAIYRSINFSYPYYIIAFLRSLFGLDQIVMKQSGSTYPTVSEDDISSTQILFIEEDYIKIINELYFNYYSIKEIEEKAKTSIFDLIESLSLDEIIF